MRFDDPELVRAEYATEERFLARRAVFTEYVEGLNAEDLALEALAELSPRRVLDVGCGTGEFAARVRDELSAEIVALDLSPRMVELARSRGIDAREADIQDLPFGAREFDCVVANWMLYHVPDLDLALAEIRRVLRPGGRLVAATFGRDHVRDLWRRLGYEKAAALEFSRENGAELLRGHFARVERRDADGSVVFPDREALRAYVASTIRGSHLAGSIPDFEGPIRADSRQTVFVAGT